jgi:DNA-binding NarL/FixJ family response regulator
MGAVRIAVVNDDRLFCDGLCQILRGDSSFMVTVYGETEARSLGDVDIRVVDARSNAALAAVVTPGGGLRPHVIVVNAPDDDAWAADALSMGVRGILSRDAGADDLVKAIHVVHEGGIWARRRWLNTYVQRVTGISRQHTDVSSGPALDQRLSKREREVFQHAATGACNKELANRLAISEATVKVHMTRIFQKLGVNGRVELVAAYYGLRTLRRTEVVRPSA